MKMEDKNGLSRVRVAVLGNRNVGKSALTVRFLTRRFIGEYRSNTDLLYRQTVPLDNGPLDVEIIDMAADTDFPVEQILWADACLIVYSITDRLSFEYASKSIGNLKTIQNSPQTFLIGNKADLDHLREVNECEGSTLAASHGIGFCEISVADNSPNLYKTFERILNESRSRPIKQRKFSVSKMIGTLIGNSNSNDSSSKQIVPLNQGTMVACCKSELNKSRVLKRRQGFAATGSL